MRLFLLQSGWVEIGLNVLMPHTGRTGRIDIPVPMLLAQTDDATYLIDTGMPDSWIGQLGDLDGEEIFPHMTASDALDSQLDRIGLTVNDLTGVINTHLHVDHAGGNRHIRHVPILVQEAELAAARAGGITRRDWEAAGVRYRTIRGDYHVCDGLDLVCDGLDLLFTPGHTLGHQSVLVTLSGGQRLLFTIDAVYTSINWDEDALSAMTDPVAGQASVERLRREAAQPRTTVIFGHDLAQWSTLRQPPDAYT